MKTIHLMLLSPYFYPTNRYQQELLFHLNRLYQYYQVSVICYSMLSEVTQVHDFSKGVRVYPISGWEIIPGQFSIPNYNRLFREIKLINMEKKIDVFFCETRFFECAWWLPFLAHRYHVPSMLIDHCSSSPKHNNKLVELVGKTIDRFILPTVINKYSLVAVSNNTVFNYLKSIGIRQIEYLGTGVDSNFFSPDNKTRPRLIPRIHKTVDEKDVVITFLARLVTTKGAQLFFDALRYLLNKFDNIVGVIGGEGPLYTYLEKHIKKSDLSRKVFLTGPLLKEEVAILLASTDIFVHPSSHHEGIPNIILEAGASACCVVASNVGGTREVIQNDVSGILVPTGLSYSMLGDEIAVLIRDETKRLTMGKALCVSIRQEYTWTKVLQVFNNQLIRLTNK